jgi:hypothetical protein
MTSGSTLSFIFTMPPVAQSQVPRAAKKIFEQADASVPQRLVVVAQPGQATFEDLSFQSQYTTV